MLLKVGVNFDPDESLLGALSETNVICNNFGVLFIITSLRDREHSAGSKHYVGKAFDMRISHMDRSEVTKVFDKMKSIIGNKYKVLLEKNHIHVEVRQ